MKSDTCINFVSHWLNSTGNRAAVLPIRPPSSMKGREGEICKGREGARQRGWGDHYPPPGGCMGGQRDSGEGEIRVVRKERERTH